MHSSAVNENKVDDFMQKQFTHEKCGLSMTEALQMHSSTHPDSLIDNFGHEELIGPAFLKKIVKSQSEVWRKNQPGVPEHLKTIRYQFLTQCFEILLKKVIQKHRKKKIFEDAAHYTVKMLEAIDLIFLARQEQIEKEEGVLKVQYRFCWLTLANQLWTELYSKRYLLTDSILEGNCENSQKLIEYILIIRREDSLETSPIFSEDSFNPQVYSEKMKEKYQYFRLEELISDEQIDKMKERINTIKSPGIRDHLLKDLDDNLVIDLADMPWSV